MLKRLAQLLQPGRHDAIKVGGIRYPVGLGQGRGEILVEAENSQAGLEHRPWLHGAKGDL